MSNLLVVGLSLLGGGIVVFSLAMMYTYGEVWPSLGLSLVFVGTVVSILGGLNTAWPHIYDSRTHWVGAETLATRACENDDGVRGAAAQATYKGGTIGWLVTCNDNAIRRIPDGKDEKNRR